MSASELKPWEIEVTEEEFQRGTLAVIEEFRANGGEVGGMYEGANLLLLTTTGARTGQRHTVPLAYYTEGERLIISSLVDTKYPSWLYNLRANPTVTVERGDETFEATATEQTGADYRRLWDWLVAQSDYLAEHQRTTALTIPIVALHR
jgi:deazaflavin-dependent oxidoreductase (nitroreductase family)